MEDALSDYEQTLLFVSHDRWFIEKFADRIWALEDGALTDFRGGWQEYRAWKERQAALQQAAPKPVKKKEEKKPRVPNADKLIAKTEREIARLEEKLAALEREAEANASDYQKLMELDGQKEALNAGLLELYDRWEELNS